MKKKLEKAIVSALLIVTTFFVSTSKNAHASTISERQSVRFQAEAMLAKIDEQALMQDAMKNVIDYSVPLSIRENIGVSAVFTPDVGVAQDAVSLEVSSTVQKVGEIVLDGNIANMYAAVSATKIKEDRNTNIEHGLYAWSYVYWIDNFGTDNELVAVKALWSTEELVVENRKVEYGVIDPIINVFWGEYYTQYPTSNSYYLDGLSITGFCLSCKSYIDIVNIGTVTSQVTSGILTT